MLGVLFACILAWPQTCLVFEQLPQECFSINLIRFFDSKIVFLNSWVNFRTCFETLINPYIKVFLIVTYPAISLQHIGCYASRRKFYITYLYMYYVADIYWSYAAFCNTSNNFRPSLHKKGNMQYVDRVGIIKVWHYNYHSQCITGMGTVLVE